MALIARCLVFDAHEVGSIVFRPRTVPLLAVVRNGLVAIEHRGERRYVSPHDVHGETAEERALLAQAVELRAAQGF